MANTASRSIVLALAPFLLMPDAIAYAHGVIIGRNSAAGLTVNVVIDMPIEVPPSVYPGIDGFADVEPGITSAEIDKPEADIYFLDFACNIQIELVSADPGVQIVTSHVWVPGETLVFGPPFFDFHLVFNIPEGEFGTVYSVVLRLTDLNSIHAGSPEFELLFTPVANICHCRGDILEDEARDGADVQSFITCFMEGGTPDAACACADMNADGAMDEADVDLFVDEILEGHECHH